MSYPIKNNINYQFNFSWITILLTFILLSTIFSDSKAKEHEDFSERFRKLSIELRCPTCQGLSVQDSEAGFSKSIKNKIIELIKEGKTDIEIMAYFVERYGEWILRSPTKTGFNLVLWLLPIVGILFGLIFVLFRSKSWIRQPKYVNLTSLTEEEERVLKEDLARFKES